MTALVADISFLPDGNALFRLADGTERLVPADRVIAELETLNLHHPSRAPMTMGNAAWPIGCHDAASCEQHQVCMYNNCRHSGKGTALGQEIDTAVAAMAATRAAKPCNRYCADWPHCPCGQADDPLQGSITPGPWHTAGRAIFAGDIMVGLASHPRDIEDEPDGKFPASYDAAIANAKLMARAPALHATLLAIRHAINDHATDALNEVLALTDSVLAESAVATSLTEGIFKRLFDAMPAHWTEARRAASNALDAARALAEPDPRAAVERYMADPERCMPSERAMLEAKGFVARPRRPTLRDRGHG